jgi:hypothetical protein
MDRKRLNYLISRLNRFELTQCEKKFIELAKGCYRDKEKLTEQQEMILEGIYKEKLRWAKLGLIREKNIARGLTKNGPGVTPIARFNNND